MSPRQWLALTDGERHDLIVAERCPTCETDPGSPCLHTDGVTWLKHTFHYTRVLRARARPIPAKEADGR